MSDPTPLERMYGVGGARYLTELKSMTNSRLLLERITEMEREAEGLPPLNRQKRGVMFAKSFLTAALERALKTVAQTLIAFLGADVFDAFDVDWERAAGISAGAAILSLLSSVASAKIGGTGPSLANEVISPPAVDPGPKDPGYGAIELLVAVLVVVILVLLILRLA